MVLDAKGQFTAMKNSINTKRNKKWRGPWGWWFLRDEGGSSLPKAAIWATTWVWLISSPCTVPCWQIFEPAVQRGSHMESLGFSVQAEHAHRNQGQLPSPRCWDKVFLPITNTAGGKNRKKTAVIAIYLRESQGRKRYQVNTTEWYNYKPVSKFTTASYPATAPLLCGDTKLRFNAPCNLSVLSEILSDTAASCCFNFKWSLLIFKAACSSTTNRFVSAAWSAWPVSNFRTSSIRKWATLWGSTRPSSALNV